MTDQEWDEMIARRQAAAAQAKVDAIRLGKDCLKRWGEFTVQKAWLRQLTAKPAEDLYSPDVDQIRQLVRETEEKAAHRLFAMRKAPPATQCIDWSDEYVAACVTYLTGLDHDRASDQNREGWSKSDSSTGHMIHAVLRGGNVDDQPAVLNAARALLGKYHRQLAAMPRGMGEAA